MPVLILNGKPADVRQERRIGELLDRGSSRAWIFLQEARQECAHDLEAAEAALNAYASSGRLGGYSIETQGVL